MLRWLVCCCLLITTVITGFESGAQSHRWTPDEWIADLDYLRVRIRSTHGNPYHTQDPARLHAAFEALRDAIPGMTDFEIAFAMQRWMVSVGDGHSWLNYQARDLSRYFLFEAYEFSDGLYITRAGAGHARAVGVRVVAIDGVPIDEVRAALAPYISRDNEMDLLRQVPMLINQPLALHAAGVTTTRDRATFSLISRDGRAFTHTFKADTAASFRRWVARASPPPDTPRYLTKIETNYWYESLPGENTVYFQFNRFEEDPGTPYEPFLEDLFQKLDAAPTDCLIIDLRHNQGGWIDMVEPVLRPLRERPRFQRPGYLYVITGRETFSASLMLVVRLARETGVLFAGEPGRGKPNSYSEFGPFVLPNTGLDGSISLRFHQESDPFDPRSRVEVHLPATLSYTDYEHGRDPALEAVLAHWRTVRSESSEGEQARPLMRGRTAPEVGLDPIQMVPLSQPRPEPEILE